MSLRNRGNVPTAAKRELLRFDIKYRYSVEMGVLADRIVATPNLSLTDLNYCL